MFRAIKRKFNNIELLEQQPREHQILFLELLLIVIRADFRVGTLESQAFDRFVSIIDWDFNFKEQLSASNQKAADLVREPTQLATYLEDVGRSISDKAFRSFIIKHLSSFAQNNSADGGIGSGDIEVVHSLRVHFDLKPDWEIT